MWMMGCDNEGSDFNFTNSFDGRKLRPLVPRPTTAISTSNNNSISAPPFSINHHISTVAAEQGKSTQREFNAHESVVVSSRWNPTPEQLRTLEELYQRGTRTPSAEQIQHITAQLRQYGKIEGKNVFYWFQNHKARERQKRRRQLIESAGPDIQGFEIKESGASKTVVFEVEQTKNWPPHTNCSTLAEESVSIRRAAAARGGGAVTECRTDDGWVQSDKGVELQQHSNRSLVEKNGTWQMMQLMSCPPPSCHHLINSTTTTTTTMDPSTDLNNSNILMNIFTTPCNNANYLLIHDHKQITSIASESQTTLQLFPLVPTDDPATNSDYTTTDPPNYQYFEFLPLKK